MDVKGPWIDLIHRAATGTKRTRTLLTPVGVLVFGAFTGLFVAAAVWVDRLLRLPGMLPDELRLPVSLPVMVRPASPLALWLLSAGVLQEPYRLRVAIVTTGI